MWLTGGFTKIKSSSYTGVNFSFLKGFCPFFFPDEDKNEERKQPGKNNLKLMTQVTKTHESEPHL